MIDAARRVCSDPACGFVQRTNPTPAVGALVEYDGDIILARNVKWPEGWFALITGYLEAGEEPTAAVERELKEELNLDAVEIHPIGNYIFDRKNEVMLCYHVVASGELKLARSCASTGATSRMSSSRGRARPDSPSPTGCGPAGSRSSSWIFPPRRPAKHLAQFRRGRFSRPANVRLKADATGYWRSAARAALRMFFSP